MSSSMRQLLDLVEPPSHWHHEVSTTLRLLIAEAQELVRRIDQLDPAMKLVIRARLDGRIDEAGFGDVMRSVGGGVKKAAVGAYQGATAVNNRVNQLGKLLQNTAPVQDFDSRFDTLKSNVAQKYPKLASGLQKYGEFAKSHPKTQAFIIGVLTAAASLAAGPVGGAVAAGLLRASNELLKGEKLSTAVGKTLKSASLGWLAGFGIHQLGAAIAHAAVPFPTNFKTTMDQMATAKWSYVENGRTVINAGGITSPAMAQSLNRAFKLFVSAHQAGNDDLAAKYYKIFIDSSNQAFDPNGAIQQALKASQAVDVATRTMLQQQSQAFAGTMAKLAGYVTAGVQGAIAGRTSQSSTQAGSVDQAPQAVAEPSQAPTEPIIAPSAPTPAEPQAPAPQPHRVMPTDMSLLRHVMNNLHDSGVDIRSPAGQRQIADQYRVAGGAWA
jgi:hypothetical protein